MAQIAAWTTSYRVPTSLPNDTEVEERLAAAEQARAALEEQLRHLRG